jgi:hypothetical protein
MLGAHILCDAATQTHSISTQIPDLNSPSRALNYFAPKCYGAKDHFRPFALNTLGTQLVRCSIITITLADRTGLWHHSIYTAMDYA